MEENFGVDGVIASTEEIAKAAGINQAVQPNVDTTYRVAGTNLPAKPTLWTKIKNVLFYEIKVELTPYQQKVEDEINEFLHQEITWQKVKGFLFQEITFGKKNK